MILSRRFPPDRPYTKGFTLIEVVVTLGIIALVAAVAVPAFQRDSERTDLELAVERVESLLRIARDSAVAGATRVRVVVDSASGAVWLSGGAEAEGPAAPASSLPLELPLGVTMTSTEARSEFVFQPGGQAFPDSVLLSSGAGIRVITLDPLTGHVVVLR